MLHTTALAASKNCREGVFDFLENENSQRILWEHVGVAEPRIGARIECPLHDGQYHSWLFWGDANVLLLACNSDTVPVIYSASQAFALRAYANTTEGLVYGRRVIRQGKQDKSPVLAMWAIRLGHEAGVIRLPKTRIRLPAVFTKNERKTLAGMVLLSRVLTFNQDEDPLAIPYSQKFGAAWSGIYDHSNVGLALRGLRRKQAIRKLGKVTGGTSVYTLGDWLYA